MATDNRRPDWVNNPQDWETTFFDDFDEPILNYNRWRPGLPWDAANNGGNNELHVYKENAMQFANSKMHIWATKPAQQVAHWDGSLWDYVSGMITSINLYEFTFGYVEARMRMPVGKGLWPAFWLLPKPQGKWPPELDIMEYLGDDVHTMYFSQHWLGEGGENDFQHNTESYTGPDFSRYYNTFAYDWQPGKLDFYLNGIRKRTITGIAVPDENEIMYILFNLAVGGNWPGTPDETTMFPQSFDVDWVRVRRRKDNYGL